MLDEIKLNDFVNIRQNGKIAMKLDNDDKIIGVKICKDDQDIILSTQNGKCIRFEVKKLRIFKGRSSKGIKGIELAPEDEIVSLSIIDNEKIKLTIFDKKWLLKENFGGVIGVSQGSSKRPLLSCW